MRHGLYVLFGGDPTSGFWKEMGFIAATTICLTYSCLPLTFHSIIMSSIEANEEWNLNFGLVLVPNHLVNNQID